MNVAGEHKEKLIAAGFEGVTDVIHKVCKTVYLRNLQMFVAASRTVAERSKA
jgi:hypothetical protein